jgi:hypothetical protein
MAFYIKLLKKLFTCFTIFYLLFFINEPAQSKERNNTLYAGVAKINITPEKSVRMAGYGGRSEDSQGVLDSLFVRVVAFEKNDKRLVFVSSDLIRAPFEIKQKIQDELALNPSELFLTATHTHAGPSIRLKEDTKHKNNLEYVKKLEQKYITVIREALDKMHEVEIGVGVGYSPIGVNRRALHPDGSGWPPNSISLVRIGRRNPYGVTDKEVLVMKLSNTENTPVGILFDFACHGTCLSDHNFLISGDIFGVAEQFVEKIVGNNVIAPAFVGASGDTNPFIMTLSHLDTTLGWIPEHVLLGTMLGEEVVRTYLDIKENLPIGKIQSDFVTIELPEKESGIAHNKVNVRKADGSTTPLNITAACIGDIGFVGLSCEALTEVGMAIKKASPFTHTFVITHCNGSHGYLPPLHVYREEGYEVESSSFAPSAAEMAVKKALDMLHSF